MRASEEKSEIWPPSKTGECLAFAHTHNCYHLGCLVISFARKLEYLHRDAGWTDTLIHKRLPEHRNADLTVKNDIFRRKKPWR